MNNKNLRDERKAAGLSMSKASRLFKVPYRTWQSWERGERRVPPMAFEILRLYLLSKKS